MENNNFYFSLLYLVQSEKPSIKSLQQYLSRDFGLAWCHSSMLTPASFPPHPKIPCFQFLQMFNSQTAQQRFFSVVLCFWLMKQCWESMGLPESCTGPALILVWHYGILHGTVGLHVYSCWSLNPWFKDSYKILFSSFPPFIFPPLSN